MAVKQNDHELLQSIASTLGQFRAEFNEDHELLQSIAGTLGDFKVEFEEFREGMTEFKQETRDNFDALTADMFNVQQDIKAMRDENLIFKEHTEEEISLIKKAINIL